MSDEGKPVYQPDWRNSAAYESMLTFDRRTWAAQCLWRDRDFAELVSSRPAPMVRFLRSEPAIAVVTLPEEDDLASWGAHFRAALGRSARRHSCDVAR